jgi:amino acid permease
VDRNFFGAAATLMGTTIGAGVLAIPYVVSKSGLILGIIQIIIIGAAMIGLNLLLAEVILKTKDNHQLTGYAGKYLGKIGKRAMAFIMLAGIYGALIAYIIGVGNTLSTLLPQLTPVTCSIIFFATVTAMIYLGINAIEKSEMLLSSAVILTLIGIIIMVAASGKFSTANFTPINTNSFFVPYGVILFAFMGAVAIPEMKEELGKNAGKQLKKAVIIGGLVPIVLYSLFAIAVIGISGSTTSEIATLTLGRELGAFAAVVANLFAIFAMSTSFISLGLALKDMYAFDYKIDPKDAWSLTCGIPLLAFLMGINGFIAVLSMIGAFVGGLEGVMIVAINKMAAKTEKITNAKVAVSFLLCIMFISGIAFTIYCAIRG